MRLTKERIGSRRIMFLQQIVERDKGIDMVGMPRNHPLIALRRFVAAAKGTQGLS